MQGGGDSEGSHCSRVRARRGWRQLKKTVDRNHQLKSRLWVRVIAYIEYPHALSSEPRKSPHEMGGYISTCFFYITYLFNCLFPSFFQEGFKGLPFSIADKLHST